MTEKLKGKLLERQKSGNFRKLSLPQSHLVDFSSNDYLGMARSSALHDAVVQRVNDNNFTLNGFGSTGSRLLTGNTAFAQHLEAKLATFHGFEAGLLFNCGYMANLGLISAIADEEDCIIFDSRIHASTHDGIRLSKAEAFPFKHNDCEHLEKRLRNCTVKGERYICIESIYSTDGSQAPLTEISRIAQKYGARLIVDEAHAVGVCGERGRGLVAEENLCYRVFAQITTFGKAPGVQGAIVLGSEVLKQALINFANPYIFTTALPLQTLAAIDCSYDLSIKMEEERKHLRMLVQFYRSTFPSASGTHIQSIPVKGNTRVKELAENVAKAGFDVRPLRSPTVRKGHEVLRICLHAFNTENELKALLEIIERNGR